MDLTADSARRRISRLENIAEGNEREKNEWKIQ